MRDRMPEQEANIALLIDADNASPDHLDEVLLVLGELGTINIRRAYGNWAKASLKGWGNLTGAHSIIPMQQFDVVKGKSATDMRMTIDAMDLLYRGNVDGFGIMSSDSDFLPLAQRIREDGLQVYGFGTAKTPVSFQQACTRFFDVGALALDDEEELEQPDDRQGPAAGRPRAAAGARRGLQGVEARRGRLHAAVRARPAGQGGVELRRAQLRLHAPFRPDQGGAQFRGEERRRRPPAGQAAALSSPPVDRSSTDISPPHRVADCCRADTAALDFVVGGGTAQALSGSDAQPRLQSTRETMLARAQS